jgi:NTP pyrophosphatase (non-canonical NTP hydrolase)
MDVQLLNSYQQNAAATAIYPNTVKLVYPILGLTGEAGEIANKYKKVLRDNGGVLTEEKRQDLIDELGDVLWYVAAIAKDINVQLSEVASRNVQKLADRASRGTLQGSGDKR